MNTAGRRVLDRPDAPGDIFDQIWADGTVDVTATTLWWGGQDRPSDTSGQKFMYSTNLDGSSPQYPGVEDPGDSAQLTNMAKFIVGDDGRIDAWSREALNANTVWEADNDDRMVTFDVSGLDIYVWGFDDTTSKIRDSSDTGSAYIVAFDTGDDGDYQDMLVLIEGANPVPVPAAVLLGFLGLSAAGIKLRKFA